MAFKMKGKPTIQGTKKHYEELKVAREATDNLPDGRSKSSPFQLSYEKSYTKEVEEKWKDKGGKDAYIKAAKDWNKDKYGTTEPTRDARKANISKEELAKKHSAPKKVEDKEPTVKKVEGKVETAPVATSREDTRKQKHKGKVAAMGKDTAGGTDITRAEQADIKVKKLTTKQETAVAEGKTRKAKRLAKRVSKRKIKAEKLKDKEMWRRSGIPIAGDARQVNKNTKLKSKLAAEDPDSKKGKRLAKRVERSDRRMSYGG